MGRWGSIMSAGPESVVARKAGSDTQDGGNVSMRHRSFTVPPAVLVMRGWEATKWRMGFGRERCES